MKENIMSVDRMRQLLDLGCRFPDQQHSLPGEARFERHVKLFSGIDLSSRASIGSFSYSWSHISPVIKSIGRYCSIAHSISFGEFEHPIDRFTTSAITFDYGMFEEAAFGTNYRTQGFSEDSRFFKQIEIGHDVWIGSGAYVRAGVKLGTGCIIGGRSIVTKDVPPYAVVVGNPGRIIKYRFDEKTIERLLKSEWWKYKFTDFVDIDFRKIEQFLELIESGNLKVFDEIFF
jgi:acetyltransferase-like isoleucine patch superfamily enzyme